MNTQKSEERLPNTGKGILRGACDALLSLAEVHALRSPFHFYNAGDTFERPFFLTSHFREAGMLE